ncbi:MAG: molybdopterin converting factor [Chloroflexi bacterium]|jgi:molybdopterin converting factor subunit 1|nr:molybdopterin converting factor [Chloroflexota bacterium]
MIELEVRLFATLKERAGRARVRVSLEEPAHVAHLLELLGAEYPALAPALESVLVAVNREFAFPGDPLADGDEVALFPPVSGGAGFPYPTYFALTTEPLDVAAVTSRLVTPEIGAVVFFQGAVRGETQRSGLPEETRYLEYEAYEGMAEEKMAQIAREIWERWPDVRGIAVVQRIGRLEIGEATTFVACAAAHRDQGAFEAARYGIDRLKEIVPVWKKEVGSDHSLWVEGGYTPTPDDLAGPQDRGE